MLNSIYFGFPPPPPPKKNVRIVTTDSSLWPNLFVFSFTRVKSDALSFRTLRPSCAEAFMKKKVNKASSLWFQPYDALFLDFIQRRMLVSYRRLGTGPNFRVKQACFTNTHTKFFVVEFLFFFSCLGMVIYKFPKASFLFWGRLFYSVWCGFYCWFFLDCWTPEDGTVRLSRNVGRKLPFFTVKSQTIADLIRWLDVNGF